MFANLFKQKDTETRFEKNAQDLYELALKQSLMPEFYQEMGVPDTFDGRFDLLLIHIFIILRHMKDDDGYEEKSQILFDVTFKNMDQTLREIGIGDMGMPKHMRRMMKAFNGRMHAYLQATDPESLDNTNIEGLPAPSSLNEVLRRNLYGTLDNDALSDDTVNKMEAYIRKSIGLDGVQYIMVPAKDVNNIFASV